MSQATLNITDTGGTLRAVPANGSAIVFQTLGAAGRGIEVGTGTTAVAIGQTQLVTLIADGAGVGQLQYGAMTVNVPVTVGATRRFTIARTFSNVSGGPITVQEVDFTGLSGTNWVFMLERSLSTQTIADLASATATYTIGVTVS